MAVLLLVLWLAPAHAQHVSVSAGAGFGSFLTGGPKQPNYNRLLAAAFTLPGDDFELRAFKGTLERSRDIPSGAGDDDFDYYGFDALATRHLTGLPVDLAAGVARFEEVYHQGYPNFDLGGRMFVHRWGPHVAARRLFPAGRYGHLWIESDLHLAPYQPRQLVLFLNVGLGAHL
jgi:hypothetical protein